jgi:hypothetical protein
MHVVSALALAGILLLAPKAALAACGDDGDPGYRKPNGQCVSWCELAECGSKAAKCKPENVSRTIMVLQAIKKGNPYLPPCYGCGCKGGPGYRTSWHKCVEWDGLYSKCGNPPDTKCEPEITVRSAEEAATAQADYARHMQACRK